MIRTEGKNFSIYLWWQTIYIKKQSRIIKFIDQMNCIQVTNFQNRSTEPLNCRIYVRPQSIKQARRPEIYNYTILPVARWVKLSLNFQLLVNRVMKYFLGHRLFNNNIFVQLELLDIQETTMLQNKIK